MKPVDKVTPTGMPNSARRGWLQQAAALGAAAWLDPARATAGGLGADIPTTWVGADHERGHRLRQAWAGGPRPAVQRRAQVLILGAGIAGLAAARAFMQRGVADVHVLDLADAPGGNSRGHHLAGMACPLGAHYLPWPTDTSHEVRDWLFELGLLRTELGRTVADERHLCHSPQERLFIDGAWAEGLLPPAEPGSQTLQQYQRFAQAVHHLGFPQGRGSGAPRAFAMPAHRARWSAQAQDLNTQTFAQWLDAQGLVDPKLRWYLDYCCRDDYGADAATVSAWAGVHYFASRHGFAAPGDESADREPVFTWPEGNAWLVQRLVAPLLAQTVAPAAAPSGATSGAPIGRPPLPVSAGGARWHGGQLALRVVEGKHGVEVLVWNEQAARVEAWQAPLVVLALPVFVAARLLESPPPALLQAARLLSAGATAPWLVANLHLRQMPLDRPGAPPSWDNVVYGGRGLGYVDAMHQSLRPHAGPTVFTAYHALAAADRAPLLGSDPGPWRERVLQELAQAHPDVARRTARIELARWGHAMPVPRPGVHRHPALQALRTARGRVRFAHADLAGYSVFEEAFTAGCEVAGPAPRPAK